MKIKLPFSGFYETIHGAVFDDALTSEIENYNHTYNANIDDCSDLIKYDFKGFMLAYVKKYMLMYEIILVDALNSDDTIDFTFIELTTPQFYNYKTDQIFVNIDDETLNAIQQYFNINIRNAGYFLEYCKDRDIDTHNLSTDVSWWSNELIYHLLDHIVTEYKENNPLIESYALENAEELAREFIKINGG